MAAERCFAFTKQALGFVFVHDSRCNGVSEGKRTQPHQTTEYIGNFQLFTRNNEKNARVPQEIWQRIAFICAVVSVAVVVCVRIAYEKYIRKRSKSNEQNDRKKKQPKQQQQQQ